MPARPCRFVLRFILSAALWQACSMVDCQWSTSATARISWLRSAHRSDRHTKPPNVDWRTQESGIQGSLLIGQLLISSARAPSASRTQRWDLMTEPIGSRSCAPLSMPSPIYSAPRPLMDRSCHPVAGPAGSVPTGAHPRDSSNRYQPSAFVLPHDREVLPCRALCGVSHL